MSPTCWVDRPNVPHQTPVGSCAVRQKVAGVSSPPEKKWTGGQRCQFLNITLPQPTYPLITKQPRNSLPFDLPTSPSPPPSTTVIRLDTVSTKRAACAVNTKSLGLQ